jgi:hypothetical protein
MIAHENGGVLAEAGVGGRPAPPERGLVDDVVVDERGRVQELDDAPEPHAPSTGIGPQRRAEENQDGSEPLPAGERDVLPELADELDGGVGQLSVDLRLAGAERVAEELEQAFAEDAFHAEAHTTPLATGRTRGRIATVSE